MVGRRLADLGMVYRCVKDFVQGTYYTLWERISHEPRDFWSQETSEDERFRRKTQGYGAVLEIAAPLGCILMGERVDTGLELIASCSLLMDAYSRIERGQGALASLRLCAGLTSYFPERKL
tara:strand:+ start:169 stop:531 length:363 start_codon:yes stop_codon:yes gene_type:complete